MKRSHFLMIVLITIFISIGAVSCGSKDEEAAPEDTAAEVAQPAADAPAVDAPVVEAPADNAEAAPADSAEVAAPADGAEVAAPADGAEVAAPADGAIGGQEGQEGVGGGAGDPVGDAIAVDPNAGGATPETADSPTTTEGEATTTSSIDITTCEPPNVPVPTGSHYVVQPCDNLYRIGLSYGLSWTVIAQANGIYYPNYIVIGQTLYIPNQPVPAPAQ